jgi:hypothetical protein
VTGWTRVTPGFGELAKHQRDELIRWSQEYRFRRRHPAGLAPVSSENTSSGPMSGRLLRADDSSFACRVSLAVAEMSEMPLGDPNAHGCRKSSGTGSSSSQSRTRPVTERLEISKACGERAGRPIFLGSARIDLGHRQTSRWCLAGQVRGQLAAQLEVAVGAECDRAVVRGVV